MSPDIQTTDRAEQFLTDLAGVEQARGSRNAVMARLGAVLLAVGVGLAALGLVLSQTTDNPLDQSTDLSLGLVGVVLSLAGLGLFLRYSFAQFLRFWLLRLIYEQSTARHDRGGDI